MTKQKRYHQLCRIRSVLTVLAVVLAIATAAAGWHAFGGKEIPPETTEPTETTVPATTMETAVETTEPAVETTVEATTETTEGAVETTEETIPETGFEPAGVIGEAEENVHPLHQLLNTMMNMEDREALYRSMDLFAQEYILEEGWEEDFRLAAEDWYEALEDEYQAQTQAHWAELMEDWEEQEFACDQMEQLRSFLEGFFAAQEKNMEGGEEV